MTEISILDPKYFTLNCKFISPNITYKDYLIEVINWSTFFRSKCHQFEEYQLRDEQSHGENDVISSQYSMDFKLFVDQETMNGMSKNKPEVDYTKENPVPVPKNNILLELISVKLQYIQNGTVNNTVKNFIKTLRKKKICLFIIPMNFHRREMYHPIYLLEF